jgi:DNA-binding SARP family transcriptional activator
VVAIVQQKRLALLIYLATAPRRRCRRRDQLVALFWPDLDDQHARGSLSQALSYLRRALGDDVLVAQGDEEVGINSQRLWCDVSAFTAALEAGTPEEALKIYRGTFLDGFFVDEVSADFEQWMSTERSRFRSEAAAAAGTLADTAEQSGQLASSIEWARRAAAIAPGDERVVARLIRLLDSSGDRAAALRVYETLRERLRAEFDVAPSPETQALLARILGR